MSEPVTIKNLHALGERLSEDRVGNVESWRKKWRRDLPEKFGDFAAEAYCALTLCRAGFAVEFASADPPDLRIAIDGVCAGVEVKRLRKKRQDDTDRVAMESGRTAGELALIGQCELTEDGFGWEQVLRSVERKAGSSGERIDYVFLQSDSDCIEEVDVLTARNELVDQRMNDPRLDRLRGIALLANWYSIRDRRSFWFFPVDGRSAVDPVGSRISGIRRWQDAVRAAW
jgi:hypothetical protein